MDVFMCEVCGHLYGPEEGDEANDDGDHDHGFDDYGDDE